MKPEDLLEERANAFVAEVYRRGVPMDDAPPEVFDTDPVARDGCGAFMRDAPEPVFARWRAFGSPLVNPMTLVFLCVPCQQVDGRREQAEAAAFAEYRRRLGDDVPEGGP